MKTLISIGLFLVLAACQHEVEPPDFGLAGFDPHMIENQTEACVQRGGRFGQGATEGTFVCYENTADANKQCTASSDCDGLCLARSGTCSPITPFFGCHEVLGRLGARSTLCIE